MLTTVQGSPGLNQHIIGLHRTIIALGPRPDDAPFALKAVAVRALIKVLPISAPCPYDVIVLTAAVVGTTGGRFSALGEMACGGLLRAVMSSDECLETFRSIPISRGLIYASHLTGSYAVDVLEMLHELHTNNPPFNEARLQHVLAVYDGGMHMVSDLLHTRGNTATLFVTSGREKKSSDLLSMLQRITSIFNSV